MRVTNIYRQMVCILFGIERWHAGGKERHLYRQEILNYLVKHKPSSLLEIGCGLGDIVCRANIRQRVGADLSWRVLWAARLCYPWQWLVRDVRFRKMELGQAVQGHFDDICAVNFIHNIPPADLRTYLQILVRDNLESQGLLVFDVVDNPQYQYNHDGKFLLGDLGLQMKTISGFEFGRSLIFAHKGAAN